MFFSCNKWKKPTDVDFYSTQTNETSLNGQLFISSVSFEIESFSFEGDREQGDDVVFERLYSGNEKIVFSDLSQVGFMDFEIPQGDYKRIDVEFDLDSEQQQSILIEGEYTNNSSQTFPFLFIFDDDDRFRVRAEDDSGGGSIILDTDVPSKVSIIINTNYIFSILSNSQMENASISLVDGVSTIVVSDAENETIYDLAVDRIEESLQVKFNF